MRIDMRRGQLSSLFRYLPDQTYNWEKGQGGFKGSAEVDTRPLNIPKNWMRRPLRRLLTGFAESAREAGRRFTGLDIVERGQFELLEPRRFRGEFFPRSFCCRGCDRFLRDSDDRPDRVRCPSCQTPMQQVRVVEYHKCGYLAALQPPRCRNDCRVPMKLTGRQSRSFADWSWSCSRCKLPADRKLYHGCPRCAQGQVRVFQADANAVFYPQSITVVNPPTEADYAVLGNPAIYPAAIAQGLGQLPAGLDALRAAIDDTGSENARQRILADLVRLFGLSEEQAREKLAEMQSLGSDRLDHPPQWEGSVAALGLDEQSQEEVGEECVELALTREAAPLTIEGLVTELDEIDPSSPLRALYKVEYADALARYGLAEITLLRAFPIAHVVAGYTREFPEPVGQQGVEFNFFAGEGAEHPMYGMRTTTEGLLFRLDPARVLRWLTESGVTEDSGGSDPAGWFFSRMRPVESVFDTPEGRLTRSVLGLLHSACHRVVVALAARSGLKTDSLTEKLMPFNLAFVVYPSTRSDFVLGGLEHVFRNYLHECLSEVDDETRCVFDPPCQSRTGACAVCMYLSEVSCERFNSALSRHYLFGGSSDGVNWGGYWSR